jgi:hypothetical protein
VKSSIDAKFLIDCQRAINLCTNVVSFRCTQENVLPALLSTLSNKSRLQTLRVRANLTAEQTKPLLQIGHLKHLAIDLGSVELMKGLPFWVNSQNSTTLTTLVLYVSNPSHVGTKSHPILDVPGAQRGGFEPA